MIARAGRKHILQERMARDVAQYSAMIVKELDDSGFAFWDGITEKQGPDSLTVRPQVTLPALTDCDKVFATAQARGTHAFQVHGAMSDERPYVQSRCALDAYVTTTPRGEVANISSTDPMGAGIVSIWPRTSYDSSSSSSS